jgi:opacity protein-like surface antigen
MRKLALGAALLSTALATPALARDDAFYVEGGFGALVAEDSEFDVNTAGTPVIRGEADRGFDAALLAGYDFGGFRLEAEGAFKRFDYDALASSTAGIPGATGALVNGSFPVDGDVDVYTVMLNGLLDFGGNEGPGLSIGGGVGMAGVHPDLRIAATGPGFLSTEDSAFAWQGLIQLRQPITENLDVGVKYRFLKVDGLEFNDTRGRGLETDLTTHSLLGTLTLNFGAEQPAPPPPPPPVVAPAPRPAPPPPPQTRTCPDGTVVGAAQPCPVPPPPVVPRTGERG